MTVLLSRFRTALTLPADAAEHEVPIHAIAYDSRAVTPGALFVAISGFHVDGHQYIPAAVAAGAAAVVVQREQLSRVPPGVPALAVADTRVALSALAAEFHGHPGRDLRVVGVTGTDGKTTTTYLISALLEAGGHVTGLMGTVEHKIGPRWLENASRQTTPEALEVQSLLAEMRAAGVTHAVIESSSHGLALHKLDHCAYDIAVATYIGEDHLELHGTREEYRAAKGKLFSLLDTSSGKPGARAGVVNADDPYSADYLRTRTTAPVHDYGLHPDAEVRAEHVTLDEAGASFDLVTPSGRIPVRIHLPGPFNVSNALAAATVAELEGVSLPVIRRALDGVRGVPGRMERIDAGQPFTVVVDYAHTGPALEKVLASLRPVTRGTITVVFGCAGGRSPERRPGMAGAAGKLADFNILTNEDPHEEEPAAILAEIAASLRAAGKVEGRDFLRIEDRRAAIRKAFQRARPGDLVLLAGKGHEQSIITGRVKAPWDERGVARDELAALGFGRTMR